MSRSLAHPGVQALLGAYAVGAIEDAAERSSVEEHLGACAECREEIGRHRETLAALVPADAASPAQGVWERISAEIRSPGPDTAPRTTTRREGRLIRFPRSWALSLAAPLAAAAAAVLITLSVTGDDDLGTPALAAPLQPVTRAPLAGTAEIYEPTTQRGRLVLDLRGVPSAPVGHHYEVWVLRAGENVEMDAVGAFAPEGGDTRLVLRLPGPGTYVAVEISIEEDGGAPEPSGAILAQARLG